MGAPTLTHAASRSPTSTRAISSPSASDGTVVRMSTMIRELGNYPITRCGFAVVRDAEMLYCFCALAHAESQPSSKRRTPRPQRTAQTRRVVRLLVLFAAIVLIMDGLVGDRGL